jgi:hypothetical protein
MALILSGTDGLSDVDGSAATPAIRGTDTNTGIFFPAADTIAFSEGGVESMRIDSSGNVGIGTSSPSQKLSLVGTSTFNTFGSGAQITIADTLGRTLALVSPGSVVDAYVGTTTNHTLNFMTGGTGKAVIDVAGNLGLGVTPSAWSLSNSSALQIRNAGFMGFSNSAYFTANAYNSAGTWRYIASAAAGEYAINAGVHEWFTAPGGTAGNAITFTQAMTLDASGNLGIGTTTVGTRLVAAGTGQSLSGTAYNVADFTNAGQTLGTRIGYDSSNGAVIASSGVDKPIAFWQFSGAAYTERMRIDSSGRLLVGLTSSGSGANLNSKVQVSQSLSVSGADGELILNNTGADPRTWRILSATSGGATAALRFYDDNAGVERMRIDTSGNILFGTTSTNTGNGCVMFRGNPTGTYWVNATSTGSSWDHYNFQIGTTLVGRISTSGSNTSYVTSSDYRLKDNIAPMTGALAVVGQLKPCTYTWKVNGSDGQGFIAHELAEVVPDAVVGEKDEVDAEGNPKYQGVDTSFLVATLTAAIQEQQALINDLTNRLTALENK